MAEVLFDSGFLKRLEMLTLAAKQLFRGETRGERRAAVHGASVEFADFRPYVQGDDFRRIDWNAYAKFEQLMLRLFVEEQELPVHILLDCSKSMDFGTPSKFDYARRLAAALAYVALANTDRVTFTALTLDDETDTFLGPTSPALRGKPSIMRVFGLLEELRPQGRTALDVSLQHFAVRQKRAGLVILISDLLSESGYEDGLKRLRYGKHDVVVVQVLAPEEIAPELLGDVRLIDMETDHAVDVSATRQVLQQYKKRVAAFTAEAAGFLRRHGGSYVLANTKTSFEDLVLRQFRMLGLAK